MIRQIFLMYRRFKIRWLSGNLPSSEKWLRCPNKQLLKKLPTEWCNNKWQVGGVLHSNNKTLVQNIVLIVLAVDRYGPLKLWSHLTLDESYWKYLINGLGNTQTPPQGPTPSKNTKRSQPPSPPSPTCPSQAPPTSHPQRQRTRPSPIPSPQEASTLLRARTPRYDTDGVEKKKIFAGYNYTYRGSQ